MVRLNVFTEVNMKKGLTVPCCVMMCRLKKLWCLGGPSFLTQIKVKFTLEQAL